MRLDQEARDGVARCRVVSHKPGVATMISRLAWKRTCALGRNAKEWLCCGAVSRPHRSKWIQGTFGRNRESFVGRFCCGEQGPRNSSRASARSWKTSARDWPNSEKRVTQK